MLTVKLFYSAFVYNDENSGSSHVVFPDLKCECDIEADSDEDFRKKAAEELGFALWMFEDAGRRLPLPKTISSSEIPEGSAISIIPIDYEHFKKHLTVKVIDLSE